MHNYKLKAESQKLKAKYREPRIARMDTKDRFAELKAEGRKLKAKDRETTEYTDYTEKTINASPPFLMHNA